MKPDLSKSVLDVIEEKGQKGITFASLPVGAVFKTNPSGSVWIKVDDTRAYSPLYKACSSHNMDQTVILTTSAHLHVTF